MGWWHNLREAIGFKIAGREDTSGGQIRDRDEDEFRRLSARRLRELPEQQRERQLKLAYELYLSNPIAFRAVEITKDFVVGDGLTFKATDLRVQQILDDFWNDPVNRWDLKQWDRAKELGLYGEQIYPTHVNDVNGKVRLGYIDPLQVVEVRTNLDNVEMPEALVIGRTASGGEDPLEKNQRTLKVIGPDEDPQSPTFGRLTGDTFFFAINKVTNAVRGNSDLLAAIDWLDTHDQFLFGVHEAAMLKTRVIWDIMVKGADAKKLEKLEAKFGQIKAGTARFHNEQVEIKTVTPDLETPELAEHARLIKNHIATAVGLPEHWLSEGGNANRATAAEMGVPTTKRLRARQIFFRNMVGSIFEYVIDQAIIHKTLPADVDRTFNVMAPQIWAIDTQALTNSLLTASNALLVAQDSGWIEEGEAAELWKFIANQLGMQVGQQRAGDPDRIERDAGATPENFDETYLNRVKGLGDKLVATRNGNATRT